MERDKRLGRACQPAAVPVDCPMEKPYFYEIRVEGHITDRWSDWFDGLAIQNEPDGDTILSGLVCDQAALFGALSKIHALNLVLIAVSRKPVDSYRV